MPTPTGIEVTIGASTAREKAMTPNHWSRVSTAPYPVGGSFGGVAVSAKQVVKGNKSLAIAVNGSLILDDLDLVIQAALDGAGLAWLAETAWRNTSRAEPLFGDPGHRARPDP